MGGRRRAPVRIAESMTGERLVYIDVVRFDIDRRFDG